jgi:hypothetical protein
MREAIRQQLIDAIPDIAGRVYETDAAASGEPKPYLVLTKGTQTDENDWAGSSTMVEVWSYVAHTRFKHVDELSAAVLSALDHQLLTTESGESVFVRFTGSASEDMLDEKFEALTRGMQFEVFSLAWMSHTPLEPDPVTAMAAWTDDRFPGMQTDPASWDPADDAPALYWRLAQVRSVQTMPWGAWIDAALRGHMLVPNTQLRNHWLDRTVRQLALDGQARMLDASPMMIQRVTADSSQDAFRAGQIAIDVRFGVLRPQVDVPPLTSIHYNGGV